MGLFPKFRLQILSPQYKRNLSLANPKAWNSHLWNLQGAQSAAGVTVDEVTALNLSAVYNAINIISSDLASIPLNLFNKKSSTHKKALTHHLYSVLHDVANPEMTAMNFREAIIAHLLAWGNAYAEKQINGFGKIGALWPIPPDHIADIKRENGRLVYYVRVNNEEIPVPRERVLHIPGLGFNGIQGYSVVSMAKEAIGLGMATEEFGARFFGAGTHPGLVVTHPDQLSKQAFDNLSGELDRKYTGLGKSHRLMLLEEGMSIEKVGVAPEDAQFLETRQFQVVEIARWFNIQPHKLKDHSRSTFNNIEELQIDHVVHCLRPWAVRLEQNINMQLLTDKERRLGYYAEHNLEGLLRGDSAKRAEFYRQMWSIGAYSQNEIRQKENENPVDGGDEYYVPLNMIPVSKQDEYIKQKTEPKEEPPQEEPKVDEEEKADIINFFSKRKIITPIGRDRIRRAYLPIFKDAGQRIINKESRAIQKAIGDSLKRNKEDFKGWLEKFYRGMPEYIQQILGPIFHSYSDLILEEAAKEIDISVEPSDETIKFIIDYISNFRDRHIQSSLGQITQIIEANEDIEELSKTIVERTNEWQTNRAEKISRNETNRLGNALTQVVFWGASYACVWRTRGSDTCPYCKALDGRKIRMGESYFAGNGEEWKPKGADEPMKIWGIKRHPPLHGGCDCYISAT